MKNIKQKDIVRKWHLFDANQKVLGRLSTEASKILMGKHKNIYTPYLDTGDYVVIINAKNVTLSGKKESQKKYYRHSGFPGGLYVKKASDIRQQKPETLLRHAIVRMLPKTRLGKIMVKKLYIYPGEEHLHKEKFQKES
ncbi:50S ribosomal protein L13 [Candidatus Curtissbacteria bacterium]|nr:50S ribosomal protein L13 [Candidatus Curtissbacteria bacterium]